MTNQNHRILIVDDNEAIHMDIKTILCYPKDELSDAETSNLENELFGESLGGELMESRSITYTIDDAYQGEEAVQMINVAVEERYPYALVLMDVRMPPGIDGVQAIKQIWEEHPNTEMVICTAYSDYSWDEIIENFGRTDKLMFLKKPFDPTALKQILLTLTTKWQLQQESFRYIAELEGLLREMKLLREESALATEAVRQANQQNEQLLRAITSILIGVDAEDMVTHWNAAAEEAFGIKSTDVIDKPFPNCGIELEWTEVVDRIAECRDKEEPTHLEDTPYTRADGREGFLSITINPIVGRNAEQNGYLFLATEITDQKILEAQLAQAQHLESIGQLAAGIAHEINTPIQYVGDNTRFIKDIFEDLNQLLVANRNLLNSSAEGEYSPELIEELQKAIREADLDYLTSEIPVAIKQSLDGVGRVAEIVRAMKQFSYPRTGEKTAVNINAAIQNTIMVSSNEWKYIADMVTDFDADLPLVPCFPGEFNQVILNTIVNAAHAIADSIQEKPSKKGKIKISTRRDGEVVEIRIGDTGTGIPDEIKDKVFDPFFTTKEVGKGTGQGLSISHAVIVEKHNGTINIDSKVGKGATVIIRLPIGDDKVEVAEELE